jgi:RimJ/RimL family protein N-acetyltransferase
MFNLSKTLRPHSILVRELHAGHREKIQSHLLELSEEDRNLRFGMHTSDEVIHSYVEKIDFLNDAVFGVFDSALQLIGFAHLAYPLIGSASKNKTAEFGVSVSKNGRGQGIGSALFKRAAIHARNTQIEILYVHYLSSNKVMMHIAKKAGMDIEFAYGEADAYLRLKPSTNASIVSEAFQAQAADIDYAIKKNVKQSKLMFSSLWPFSAAAAK